MLKMTIDNEEVVSKNNFTIKEEMLSPSSTILNNTYPKTWEDDKDYISRFYYPKDYAKLNIQNFSITPEEAGTTIQINGSATLTDVDTTKESRVLRLLGQTSQNGTPTPDSPVDVNVVTGDNTINICGKNLLPNNATSQTINGITFTINSDKSITINGTASGRADLYIYGQSTDNGNYVKIPKGIYSIDTSRITNGKLFYMFREKTAGTTFATSNNSSAISLMSSQDCYFYGIMLAVENGTTLNNYTIYPMLEKGSTATTYEPYTGTSYPIYLGDIELCKIGTYQDYIYKDNGGWYLHKEIGKVVLTGASSEMWSRSGASTSSSFVGALNLHTTGIGNKFGTCSSWLCDKFTYYPSLGVDYKFYAYNGDATTGYQFFGLTIPTTMASDLSSFKTWLSNNNVTLYYILATSTNTEITDTLLLSQLDALESQ